jgi:hypothetical protein
VWNGKRRVWLVALVIVSLGGWVSAPIRATLVRSMDLREMVESADDVTLVRVLTNRVVTDPQTHYHYTVTRFEVLEAGKGNLGPGGELELELIGGQAPGSYYRTVVADVPRFHEGEQLILFTKRTATGRQLLVGLDGAMRLGEGTAGPIVLSPPIERSTSPLEPVQLAPSRFLRVPPGRVTPTRSTAARTASPGETPSKRSPRQPALSLPRQGIRVDAFLQRVRKLAAGSEEGSR